MAASITKLYTKESADVYFNGTNGLPYSKSVNLSHKLKDKGVVKGHAKKKKLKRNDEENEISFTSNECMSIMNLHWRDSFKKSMYEIHRMTGKIDEIINMYKTYSDGYYFVSLNKCKVAIFNYLIHFSF